MKLKPIKYKTARRLAKWLNYATGLHVLVWLAWWIGMATLFPTGFKGIANTALSLGWLPLTLVNQFVQTVMIRWSWAEDERHFQEISARMNAAANAEIAAFRARFGEQLKTPPLH